MLPDQAIAEFKALHLARHGVELSDEDAREQAEKLVGLYQLLQRATVEQQNIESNQSLESKAVGLSFGKEHRA